MRREEKISMVRSIFFSITRSACDICIGQVCAQSIYNLLSRLIYYYHCRKLVGVLLYRCDKGLNCLRVEICNVYYYMIDLKREKNGIKN